MALWLVDNEPRDYEFVCTPTGDELPEMIAHWIELGKLLGSRILPVTCGQGLSALIKHHRMLPNHRARWCTRQLKIEPYFRYLSQFDSVISYVGTPRRRKRTPGMIFPETANVSLRFPLREIG